MLLFHFNRSFRLGHFLLAICFWICATPTSFASSQLKPENRSALTFSFEGLTYTQSLDTLSVLFEAELYYSPDDFDNTKVQTVSLFEASLEDALDRVLLGSGMIWREAGGSYIIKKRPGFQVNKYSFSGVVTDEATGETLVGATVWINETQEGISTNPEGYYAFTLPEGNYSVRYQSVGFDVQQVYLSLTSDTVFKFNLPPQEMLLEEVNVLSEKEDAVENLIKLKSSFKVKSSLVKGAPTFLGEADLIKTLQLLPGIQTGAEGQAGMFVRGGKGDQNLILLDDIPIYNPSHILGLYSVFNPDVIKEVEVYKGGIPAKFGGRLSSVVDVQGKEGNNQNTIVQGSVGSIASRLSYERPLFNEKGSMIVAARRTYLDLLLRAIPDHPLEQNSLYFYDLNLKANYRPSENNAFSVTGYLGRDVTGLPDVLSDRWGNTAISAKWSHLFSKKWYSSLTAYFSRFSARSTINFVDAYGYDTRYSIRDMGFRFNNTYYANNSIQYDYGWESTHHRYLFGEVIPTTESNSNINERRVQPSFAWENNFYFSLNHTLNKKVTMQYGLRYSRFDIIGPGRKYLYANDPTSPSFQYDPEDEEYIEFSGGKPITSYQGLEPRFSLRVLTGRRTALKFSYNRTRQYTHQLSNTNTPSPSDMWAPVNAYIPPQVADQISAGLFRNFPNNVVEFSLEAYYKRMQDQIDFKPLPNLILNDHLETEILLGEGQAYGIETLLRKHKGRFTGWVSYTLSRSERQIDGINAGTWYPTSFDRMHSLSVVGNFYVTPFVQLSANWVFASGVAYTFPSAKYSKDGFIVPFYTERNGFRLPATHRLDLSCTVYRRVKKKNQSSFNFSIYNAYARRNTYAIIFRQKEEDRTQTESVKLYLFSIVPAFSYNFKF